MSTSNDALVLVLYCGGTIGMLRPDPHSGFEPFPSFLTETLRSQARFHDPVADSVYSWSDTADRFKTWSDTYTRSPSGAATPQSGNPQASNQHAPTADGLIKEAARRAREARPAPIHHDSGVAAPQPAAPRTSHAAPAGPPFSPPVTVRSTVPDGVSRHHAVSSTLSTDGQTLELSLPTLVTPRTGGRRVRYAILEYDPLLDSSDMDMDDWARLARDIAANYTGGFDGFVVLHGTDTMAYTSSALAFLLEDLGKPVILTGAQVPLSQLRNDAIENMLGALLLAGTYAIPEVTLYFAGTLHRGTRARKTSNNALAAFTSPNAAPLARVGLAVEVAWSEVLRPRALRPLRAAATAMARDVAVLRLFPGLPASTVSSFLAPPLRGAVLESYGAGNAPSRPKLLRALADASTRGVVIVNITQCPQGEVSALYALGRKLEAAGVVPGGDMTPECALAKLAYLLGKRDADGLGLDEVRAQLRRPLRGEMTVREHVHTSPRGADTDAEGSDALNTLLAHALGHVPPDPNAAANLTPSSTSTPATSPSAPAAGVPSPATLKQATTALLPLLIHRAASENDIPALNWHIAALERLTSASASASAPTTTITATDQPLRIRSPTSRMHSTTAHPATSISTSILTSTSTSTYPPAPAPARAQHAHALSASGALHAAAAHGHADALIALLQAGCGVHARDGAGQSALYVAARGGHGAAVRVLRGAGAHFGDVEGRVARAVRAVVGGSGDEGMVWGLAMGE